MAWGISSWAHRLRRIPFYVKLIAAAIVPLIIVLYFIQTWTNEAVAEQFRDIQVQKGNLLARGVIGFLVSYYETRGDWEGVQALFHSAHPVKIRERIGDSYYLLADQPGRVIVSSNPDVLGYALTEEQLAKGVPIEVEGQRVGTLFVGPVLGETLSDIEAGFLSSLNRSIWLIGVTGGAVGIVLILIFYGQLARFARRFSQAAQRIAQGAFEHRIEVRTHDEIGQLALAFNEMVSKWQFVQQLRSNMIADIAHELRTPLTVIRADLEALESGILPASQQIFRVLHEQMLRLSRLVDDLMELHLAEAGGLPLHPQEADLMELIEGLAAHVRPAFDQLLLHLEVQRPERTLPAVEIDVERIEQVLLNLLTNAQRHTPKGGRVTIALESQESEVQIRISDNGCGIAPEDLLYVFDRFYRAKTSGYPHDDGAGLGLAIARSLIEAHGGRIDATSQLGRGTTFTLTLPISQKHSIKT
jgi:signal transduction histidine kinase